MQLDGLLAGRDVDAGGRVGSAASAALSASSSAATRAATRSTSTGGIASPLEHVLAQSSTGTGDRVVAGEAGGAERRRRRAPVAVDEPVEVEVGERVDAEVVADLADRMSAASSSPRSPVSMP